LNERSISTAQLSYGTPEFVINTSAIHSPEETFESLKTIFEDEQILKIGYGVKQDIIRLERVNIKLINFYDIQYGHYVLNYKIFEHIYSLTRLCESITKNDKRSLKYLRLDVHNLLFIFQQLYGLLLMKHIQWKNIPCHDKSSRKTANYKYTALSYFSDGEKKEESDEETPTITLGLTANEHHEVENAFPLKTMWQPTRGALSDRLDSNCSADTRESDMLQMIYQAITHEGTPRSD
ncbi:unnamed protein product, partial [Didymodactylos carnosus]